MTIGWMILFALPLSATTIAVVVTPEAITVAADSASVAAGEGEEAVQAVCKIQAVNGLLFLASGTVNDRAIGFSVFDLAANASRGESRGAAAREKLNAALLSGLPKVVANTKSHFQEKYKRWTVQRSPIVEVMFGSVDSAGRARLDVCQYRLSREVVEPSCFHVEREVVLAGSIQNAYAAVRYKQKDHYEAMGRADPAKLAETLVNLEIDAARRSGSQRVAAPVAVAIFDGSGLRFIKPGSCATPEA